MKRRKGKKRTTRRPRTPGAGGTFSTSELLERYGCTQRTLRRWTRERDYPHGTPGGRREYRYLVESVYAWERKHMPHLHPTLPPSDDQQAWDDLSAVIKGQRAAARIEGREKKEEKPKRRAPRRKK